MLTQFIAAFDDAIINRYDDNRVIKEKVEVRYVLAGKQRVMYDIVNQNQNLTLPVVAIDIKSIARDATRVHHKLGDVYMPATRTENFYNLTKFQMPIPVNVTVSMSILTRYALDMHQIVSNFVPYNNPYIIISWKVPSEIGPAYDIELRSEVLWDGNITFNNPIDLTYSDKIRFVGDTTFTIKGWLFKTPLAPAKPIYFIDIGMHAVNNKILNYDSYYSLSSADLSTDHIYISGYPSMTNIFLNTSGTSREIREDFALNNCFSGNFLILYGQFFHKTTHVLLSANNLNLSDTLTLTSFNTTYTGPVTGYIVPEEYYEILTDTVMKLNLPLIVNPGKFDIIINNPAGWQSSYMVNNFNFIVD